MTRPLAFGLAVLLLVLTAAGLAEEPESAKILLIGKQPDHPYGSHMYLHTCGVLGNCLELTPGIETRVSDGWPRDEAALAGVKSIVVYSNPAAEMLLDGRRRDEVDRLMKGGVGLVTIHWASSVQEKNLDRLGPKWLEYLGGTWVSNVGLGGGASKLEQLQPEHPICRGWEEYEIVDEYYLNPVIAEATPLLQVQAKGQDVIVGWAHQRAGGGRSYATTLGHPYKNFQQTPFRRMLVNAILWTAHLDVPEEGAPVDLPEKQLALPPKE